MKTNKLLISLMGFAAMATTACEKTDRSFSLLDAGSSFQQSANYVPRPIDVLWVVDNSGSMESSQNNLTANFQSFMNSFQQKGYDFHMAVVGSDAWRAAYQSNAINKEILASARKGAIKFYSLQDTGANFNKCGGSGNPAINPIQWLTDSGSAILTKNTPNVTQTFLTNATQGICGTGDERAFQSIKEFLNSPVNAGFRRPEASLAIIIVSDEDDFSASTSSYVAGIQANGNPYDEEKNSDPVVLPSSSDPANIYNLYRDSRLHTVQSYKDFLDSAVGAGNYSVNMIGILDQQCKTDLNTSFGGRRIGRRYMELADMTGGLKTSLCANFGESLEILAKTIVSKNGVFKLDREPVESTLKVIVNGTEVPNSSTWGWTYNPATLEITFSPEDAIPNSGDNVQILFTPVRANN